MVVEMKSREKIAGHEIDTWVYKGSSESSIILIHGIGVSSRYFIHLAHQLRQYGYTVHRIDLPGYGKTPKPASALNLDQLAEVVDQYVQHHAITRPILIGQSMGCQIVTRVAAVNRQRYDKVTLIGPTVNKAERTLFRQSLRLLQDTLRESARMNLTVLRDYLRMGIGRYLQTTRYMLKDAIEEGLALYGRPVLLLRGERDCIVPVGWLRYLAEIIPGSAAYDIPAAPHIVQDKFAEEVAALCHDFIRD